MLQRVKALEDRQQDNVENGLSDLAAYGIRRNHDFDKYKALSMPEDLIAVARNTKHEKYYFQNESECFIGVSKHRETIESTRP